MSLYEYAVNAYKHPGEVITPIELQDLETETKKL
jgi:hypothetical protein